MRKREFIKILSSKLINLSKEERDNVIEYYDELIEDTIDRTNKREEDVIASLGSIDEIVRKVSINNANKIKYEEDRKERFCDTPHTYKESTVYHKETVKTKVEKKPRKVVKTEYKRHNTNFFKILILVLTFPVWFSLICVLISLMITFGFAGFGVGIAGVAVIIQGITQISSQLSYALFEIGGGILCVGLAFVFAPILCKIVSWIFKGLCKFINWLAGGNYKTRKVCYEN